MEANDIIHQSIIKHDSPLWRRLLDFDKKDKKRTKTRDVKVTRMIQYGTDRVMKTCVDRLIFIPVHALFESYKT